MLNWINCGTAILFKKKSQRSLKYYFGQNKISNDFNFNQIEENSNILGVCFQTFSWFLSRFNILAIIIEPYYNGYIRNFYFLKKNTQKSTKS